MEGSRVESVTSLTIGGLVVHISDSRAVIQKANRCMLGTAH